MLLRVLLRRTCGFIVMWKQDAQGERVTWAQVCVCVCVGVQGWWLLVGRELRMLWEGEEGVEPWRVGDWPPGPPTPQSPIPTLILRGPVGVRHTRSASGPIQTLHVV